MLFLICPYRRFPVQCYITYNAGSFQDQDTIWNLSGDRRCDHLQHVGDRRDCGRARTEETLHQARPHDINTEFAARIPSLILAARYADYGTVPGLARWYKEEGT
jgi:hypothetical protein